MPPTPSTVSFTVRRPTPASRPSSSGPESDGPFKRPALPRHLASAGSSRTGSPLAGSPRAFGSREHSDYEDEDGETGIVFANGSGADANNTNIIDSSDEDDFVFSSTATGQRSLGHKKKKKKTLDSDVAPLVIPSQPNPDWRELARRRRAACSRVQPPTSRATPSFVPNSGLAATGADGSVGGLGTKDTINSGPQLAGLQISKKVKVETLEEDGDAPPVGMAGTTVSIEQTTVDVVVVEKEEEEEEEETEDQKALRAILTGQGDDAAPVVEIIPVPPLSEADALRQDVQDLPDVATADDYERVPISAFGAAMLRGMGWTDGAVASKGDKRRKNGLKELYLPQSRPALLGIGAKEQEPEDDGSGKKKAAAKRPDMRYVPVAREGGGSSGTMSRRSSRSPSRRARDDRERRKDREREGDRERDGGRDRDRDRRDRDDEGRRRTREYDERVSERKDYKSRDRDRDSERERAKERGRGESYGDRERDGGRRGRDRQDDR